MSGDANPAPAAPPNDDEANGAAEPLPGPGAFEVKYLLSPGQFDKILTWARSALAPDPYAAVRGGDDYRVDSLYFDTRELDVYRQTKGYRESKLRVRRYGRESVLYLEEKRKKAGFVRKRRTPIEGNELSWLAFDASSSRLAGAWFRARLRALALEPVCRVAYDRIARVGADGDGPVRLTLDRNIVCGLAGGLEFSDLDMRPLRPVEGEILELKYRGSMPAAFRELVATLRLDPDAFSKYRTAAERQGLTRGQSTAGLDAGD
jgi:hypothetical protein